jgi:hypothetical protein
MSDELTDAPVPVTCSECFATFRLPASKVREIREAAEARRKALGLDTTTPGYDDTEPPRLT